MDSELVVNAVATLVYNGTTYVLKAPMLNTTIPVDFILQNADIVAATPALNWPTSSIGYALLVASIIATFALSLYQVFLVPLWIGGWLMTLAGATVTNSEGLGFSVAIIVITCVLPAAAGLIWAVTQPEEYRKVNNGFDFLKRGPIKEANKKYESL